jgi:HAMP domain-containing protein/class 3 adenylate cyclase
LSKGSFCDEWTPMKILRETLREPFRKVLPILVCFLVLALGAFAYLWSEQVRVMSGLDVSLERVITGEGAILDLRDTTDDLIWLRKMDTHGRVQGQMSLPKIAPVQDDSSTLKFLTYHIVGAWEGEVLLYEYGYSPTMRARLGERVIACDLATGKVREVGSMAEAGTTAHDVTLYSSGVVNGGFYFGFESGTHSEAVRLVIKRMDVASGVLSDVRVLAADFDIVWFNRGADGAITAVSRDSDVYRYRLNEWELLYESAGKEAMATASVGEDGTSFFFMTSERAGTLYRLPLGGETLERVDDADVEEALSVVCLSEDSFITKERIDEASGDSFGYGVSIDGERREIVLLAVPFGLLWTPLALLRLGGVLAALVLLALLAAHIRLRRHTGLAIKQILAAIPIFALGLLLLFGFTRTLVSDLLYTHRYLTLSEKGADAIARIDGGQFARIDWDAPLEDPYFLELQEMVDGLSVYSQMSWWQSDGAGPAWWDNETIRDGENQMSRKTYTSHWMLRVEGDEVYTALCENYPVNLELAYINKMQRNASIDELIKEKYLPVRMLVYDSGGEGYWLAVLLPVLDGTKLVGILEVSEPALGLEAETRVINTVTLITAGLIMLVALLAIIFVLHFTLRDLRRLKAGAQAVSAADYSKRVGVRSHDEVGDIGTAFDAMAESVAEAIDSITTVSQGYSRFVPERLIEALGKSSIRELERGAHTDLETTNMFLSTDSFDEYQKEDFFKMLNLFYGAMLQSISNGGGIIDRFSGNGFSALFYGDVEDALDTVITMYGELDRVNDQLLAQGIRPIECHVMLNRSSTLLGVAGTDTRLDIISVSSLGYKTEKVAALGRLCGCRLLLAQSAFDALGEVATGHPHRWLGYIRVEGRRYRLYDFYFCEAPALRRLKAETKESFERGVRLYCEGNYREASSTFVRVVKASPADTLAREYLLRCHNLELKKLAPTELMEL